jgi:hypothetical protein
MSNSTLEEPLLFTRRRAKQKLKSKSQRNTPRSITRDGKFILHRELGRPAHAATKRYVTNRLFDVTKRNSKDEEQV